MQLQNSIIFIPFHGAGPAQIETGTRMKGHKDCFKFLPAFLSSLRLSISIINSTPLILYRQDLLIKIPRYGHFVSSSSSILVHWHIFLFNCKSPNLKKIQLLHAVLSVSHLLSQSSCNTSCVYSVRTQTVSIIL